jgi:regulation of enolase protein 1 (concanavalin A-like superfamily)
VGVPPEGDFGLAARVRVEFASAFDAGVLLVYAADDRWAKLCFECSPRKTATAVTVVTRGTSDDANAFEVSGDTLWLRITRSGGAWAFHASTDGQEWRLLRYFTLRESGTNPGPTSVGFLAQSPTGQGCTAVFDEVTFTSSAPGDMRDGS